MFADSALATLELDPAQAELIINAATSGMLSLVLRPTADTGEADRRRAAGHQPDHPPHQPVLAAASAGRRAAAPLPLSAGT